MKVKSLRQAKNLAGKTVLLRADLNVPVKNGLVKDDFKIVMTLPTARFLLRHNCRLIVITHLDKGLSARPVASRLSRLLGRKVKFTGQVLGGKTSAAAKKLKAGEVLFLENLRLDAGEEKNSSVLARGLAGLADVYVNDAFGVSHRAHASVSAVKNYLPAYAGLLLEKEITNLSKILKPKAPLVSVIGGAKIETKLKLIGSLAKKSRQVLIGGALANNFLAASGLAIGKSLADKKEIALARSLIRRHKNLVLPVDAAVGPGPGAVRAEVRAADRVAKAEMILDIGPNTVRLFAGFLKKANTIIWNGPLGYFENEHFKHGTLAVARLIAARATGEAFGAAGGGETVAALRLTGMEHYLDWISTGGGAMLAFLAGEKMPGLDGIVK